MRYAIPLLKNRVSPRCTIADKVVLVSRVDDQLDEPRQIPLQDGAWTNLIRLLLDNRVETLVAGGIARETQQMLISHGLTVIDNVVCSEKEVLQAVADGTIRSGYGLSAPLSGESEAVSDVSKTDHDENGLSGSRQSAWESRDDRLVRFDCLDCNDRVCLRGMMCYAPAAEIYQTSLSEHQTMADVARDISCEEDRHLCRVAELVYFCLGMKYRRIGIAYCTDLMEPAGILVGLLRRYFEVFPICCKVGGIKANDILSGETKSGGNKAGSNIVCNPVGQAEVLNRLKTDMNIVVGLCVGADCLFATASHAPVSTLFVKDKSLVNNPIGALYSDYYLNEVKRTPTPETA